MVKHLLVASIVLLQLGCNSAVIVDKGFLVHEEQYKVPVLTDTSWLRFIPFGPVDALYLRCPEEQHIIVFNVPLCKKFDHSSMTPEDYVKRIYLNTYFPFGESFWCKFSKSPLTDKNFQKLHASPDVNIDKNEFTIVYDTKTESGLCGSETELRPVRIKDVFMEDPRLPFIETYDVNFVVLRYVSPEEHFEKGLSAFNEMVSRFQWMK